MKTVKIFLAVFSFMAFMSCGPKQQEQDLQKQKEDSLMEIERTKALDNADKLLKMQDSMTSKNDTTALVKK